PPPRSKRRTPLPESRINQRPPPADARAAWLTIQVLQSNDRLPLMLEQRGSLSKSSNQTIQETTHASTLDPVLTVARRPSSPLSRVRDPRPGRRRRIPLPRGRARRLHRRRLPARRLATGNAQYKRQ